MEEQSKLDSKIVFISRVDTYFGRILAQHLAHASPFVDQSQERDHFTNDQSHLSFLDRRPKTGFFKIFGTFRPQRSLDPHQAVRQAPKIPAALGLCPSDDLTDVRKMVAAADISFFHIADHDGLNELLEDTARAIEVATEVVAEKKSPKKLLLLSTAMTWARTKERATDDTPNGQHLHTRTTDRPGFCEEEFRRRKPHPNFRRHWQMEKKFLEIGRDFEGLVTTAVIAAGVIYGYGENFFHWMFREAWSKNTGVPVLGQGANHIATIHAGDLCQIVQKICLTPPRNHYVIAVDDSRTTLLQIGEAISRGLSDGSVEHREPDDALMKKEVTPFQLDVLTTDLVLEPTTVREETQFEWKAPNGFVAALPRLVEEYKIVRNLRPLKLAVFGPPFSGKTTLAKSLSRQYSLPYVDVGEILQKGIRALEHVVGCPGNPHAVAEATQILQQIQSSKSKNGGRIADHFVTPFVRDMLNTLPCRNQGFVLDGYPESYASAKDLFAKNSFLRSGREEEDPMKPEQPLLHSSSHNHSILPDFVFFLEASEDFLKQRIFSQLHDSSSESEPPIEVSLVGKFAEFNFLRNEEDKILTFFEEANLSVDFLDISGDPSEKMEKTLHAAMRRIGRPVNYPLSQPERLALLRQEAERRVLQIDQGVGKNTFFCPIGKIGRDRNSETSVEASTQWKRDLERMDQEERRPTRGRPFPMKQYLMTHIFPVLTDALTTCLAVRPADPVDFLAEFLLRKSRPLYCDEKVSFIKMTSQAEKRHKRHPVEKEKTGNSPDLTLHDLT